MVVLKIIKLEFTDLYETKVNILLIKMNMYSLNVECFTNQK